MSSSDAPWTIGRLLTWTAEYLGKHGSENPRLEAEVLLAEARGCKRIDLYAAFGDPASEEVRVAFRELVRRRAEGTPVAYLVGHREFYALDFEVNPDVLIPRPETELVVVALLDAAKVRGAGDWELEAGCVPDVGNETPATAATGTNAQHATISPAPGPQSQAPIRIADVGTGSGILAVCAAKYLPGARVTAIDISPAALAVARRNAEKHGVADRLQFLEGDLLASLPAESRFDYIISNPPYVSESEMDQLARDVREQEPRIALCAGETGTEIVARLIEQATPRLVPGGKLLIEISPMIAPAVEQLIKQQPSLDLLPTMKDFAGLQRVIHAKRVR